jgi:hypothetical protein
MLSEMERRGNEAGKGVSLPPPAVFAVAYLGAGVYYAAADILSEARYDQSFKGVTGLLATTLLACIWAPASVATVARYSRQAGWRTALAYFGAFVAPALALFVGAVIVSAAIVS